MRQGYTRVYIGIQRYMNTIDHSINQSIDQSIKQAINQNFIRDHCIKLLLQGY